MNFIEEEYAPRMAGLPVHRQQVVAGEEMQVDMEDGLAAAALGVDQQAVTLLAHSQLLGDIARLEQHAPQQGRAGGIDLVHRVDVAVGDDENVDGGGGVMIPEGRQFVILVDDAGGLGAGYDLAEDARFVFHIALHILIANE